MALSKTDIFGVSDRKTETVNVPEWGGDIVLRTISGADRDRFEDSLTSIDNEGNIKTNLLDADARLLVKCIVDENGERIFSDADAKDLAGKSAAVLARLAQKARELNSLGAEAAKAVDEAGKDSGETQPEDSTSESPTK